MTRRVFTPLDGLVVAAILAANWAFSGITGAGGASGGVEVVSMSERRTVALESGEAVRVEGPLGATVIHVSPEGVRFHSSPCPNQLCVRSGLISEPGEVTVCLPNRVAARILPRDEREGVDAVAR